MASKFTVKIPSHFVQQVKGITPEEMKTISKEEFIARSQVIQQHNNERESLATSIQQLLKDVDITWHGDTATISCSDDLLSTIENTCQTLGLETTVLRDDIRHKVDKDGIEGISQKLDNDIQGKHKLKERK